MRSSWNEPTRSRWWWIVIPLCGAILIIPSLRSRAEQVVHWIGAHSIRGITNARARTASEAAEQVRILQEQLAIMVVSSAKLAALEEENALLRQQANVSPQSGFELIGAQVVTRVMEPDRSAIVLDRGRQDEVEVGQAVLAGDGVIIGKIVSLTERTATVQLVTDPRSRFAATLSGEARLLGVVEGRGNGAARMTYIPASQPIKKDQIVVTSGTEEKIPPHLPLGLVNAVEGKNTDPFVSAVLEPLLPLDRLRLVSILRPVKRSGR